jgi:hypothetical protein
MKKLVEENEKIDRQDEEINGKIDRRGWRKIDGKFDEEDEEMAPLALSPFWLKGDLFEYFII